MKLPKTILKLLNDMKISEIQGSIKIQEEASERMKNHLKDTETKINLLKNELKRKKLQIVTDEKTGIQYPNFQPTNSPETKKANANLQK